MHQCCMGFEHHCNCEYTFCSGGSLPVTIKVGNQDSTSSPTFSYKTPAISKVSPTLGGGDLIFTGTDFANAAVTIEITDTQTNQVTTCPSPLEFIYRSEMHIYRRWSSWNMFTKYYDNHIKFKK